MVERDSTQFYKAGKILSGGGGRWGIEQNSTSVCVYKGDSSHDSSHAKYQVRLGEQRTGVPSRSSNKDSVASVSPFPRY